MSEQPIHVYPHGIKISSTFPVVVGLQSDGMLFLQSISNGKVYDHKPEGISGMFDNEGFSLWKDSIDNKLDYVYNAPYAYKEMPMLKEWLIQQHLVPIE